MRHFLLNGRKDMKMHGYTRLFRQNRGSVIEYIIIYHIEEGGPAEDD